MRGLQARGVLCRLTATVSYPERFGGYVMASGSPPPPPPPPPPKKPVSLLAGPPFFGALAIGLIGAAFVSLEPAGAEDPQHPPYTVVTRTTTSTVTTINPYRNSEERVHAVEAQLDVCNDVGVHCEYSEGRPVDIYEDVFGERVAVTTFTPQIVKITTYTYENTPEEPPMPEWTAETSGCRTPQRGVWCGYTTNPRDQRATIGSQSRPRNQFQSVIVVTEEDHDDDSSTDAVIVRTRTRATIAPVLRNTLAGCERERTTGTNIAPSSTGYVSTDDSTDAECAPVHQFAPNSFNDAQQYGTLRRITTPEPFDFDEYVGDDGEWTHEESDRANRAFEIHSKKWDAYEQAVADAYERDQPFWTCTHESHYDDYNTDAHDGSKVYPQCSLQNVPSS